MDGIDSSAGMGGLAQALAGSASTGATRTASAAPAEATPAVNGKSGAQPASANLISLLADAAPPIDSKKVEAIRSLIGQGRYPIDEHAIAAKMVALDIPKG